MNHDKALYPIREIARLTGVSPITLRAWERRYGLIEPVRTDSGHRLYNQAHIDYINEAVELTKQGVAISKVKSILADREQQKLSTLEKDEESFVAELVSASRACNDKKVRELLAQLYIEFWHEQIQKVLIKVTFELNNEANAARLIWQTCVLPLLYSRVYQASKLTRFGQSEKVLLVGTDQSEIDFQLKQAIICNELVSKGAKPFLGKSLISNLGNGDSLLAELKALHCGVLLIYQGKDAVNQLDQWLGWAKRHQSIEVVYITAEQIELANPPLNFKCFLIGEEIVLN